MAQTSIALSVKMCKDVALEIIDRLPADEFCSVAEEVKRLARKRSLMALEQMRQAVRKSDLTKDDFDEALREVRAEARKKRSRSRH